MKKKNKNVKKNTSNEQKIDNDFLDIENLVMSLAGNDEANTLDEEAEKGINIVNTHNEKLIEDRQERLYEKSTQKVEEKNDVRYKVKPIFICLLTVIIILIVYGLFEYGPIFGFNINRNSKISEDSKIDIVTNESDIYKMYNQELLIYSNNVVSTYNNYLQKTWSYSLSESFTPNIYINNSYMAIVNNSNGTIYMFDNKREIFNKKIDGTIQDVYIDDYGNIAVEYSTTGYKKIIGVYDKSGKSKFDTYLSLSTIIDIKIIDNCKKLLIVQASTNSFNVGITLNIVDSTKKENNISELCKFDNNMLYDINVQGQYAICLLDNKISRVDLNNGNVSDIEKFDNSQLLFVAIYKDYYTYLSQKLNNNNSENNYTIVTKQYDGINISELEVSNTPKILHNSGLLNYLVYQDSLQVVNKWGIEIKNIPMEFIPKDIIVFNNEKSIGLVYTNKIYIVNI